MRRAFAPVAMRLVCGSLFTGCLLAPALQAQEAVSDRGLKGFVTVERLAVPDSPALQDGRLLWGANCSNCHGGNKETGAPKITSSRAWGPRIDKGVETLVAHALNGFVGPTYTQMPARGANPDLTDEEVTLAVLFMVWASGGADQALAYLQNTHQHTEEPEQ